MRLAAFALAALTACSGGGGNPIIGSSDNPIVSAPLRTTKAHVCYYAGRWQTITAYADHTNCIEPGWWADRFQGMALATNAGIQPVVLMLPDTTCTLPLEQVESETTAFIDRLNVGKNLSNVLAVRPCDEPKISDAQMKAVIIAVHAAMAKYPSLVGKPLTMYYPCSDSARPGIAFIDWPGCDVYDWDWPRIFRVYEGYEVSGESDRGVAMIDGGSDPWRQDPAPMVEYALHNDSVKLVQGFCYDPCGDVTDAGSIAHNGMLPAFKAAFARLL